MRNFNLEFISPVISTVDPKAVKDATVMAQHMPTELTISNVLLIFTLRALKRALVTCVLNCGWRS